MDFRCHPKVFESVSERTRKIETYFIYRLKILGFNINREIETDNSNEFIFISLNVSRRNL